MNELLVIFVIIVTLALGYLVIYPKVAGNDVRKMAWLDVGLTLIPVIASALLFWQSDPEFSLIFFDTNWFTFTIIALVVIEIPVFLLYLKARGLGDAYLQMMKASWTGGPARESVERELNDVKWDGLRTSGSKILLLVGSNFVLIVGTVGLWLVGDTPFQMYVFIQIALIFINWFLLRKSVRLVADSPAEFLDERLVQIRNRAYVVSYRALCFLLSFTLVALLIVVIVVDSTPESNGFSYNIQVTWPQAQAVFWFFFGYSVMLPSMAVIWQDLRTRVS